MSKPGVPKAMCDPQRGFSEKCFGNCSNKYGINSVENMEPALIEK